MTKTGIIYDEFIINYDGNGNILWRFQEINMTISGVYDNTFYLSYYLHYFDFKNGFLSQKHLFFNKIL
jgi:hypothetical protein